MSETTDVCPKCGKEYVAKAGEAEGTDWETVYYHDTEMRRGREVCTDGCYVYNDVGREPDKDSVFEKAERVEERTTLSEREAQAVLFRAYTVPAAEAARVMDIEVSTYNEYLKRARRKGKKARETVDSLTHYLPEYEPAD